jgi:TonB family protein
MTDFKDDIEKYRKGELTSAEMHSLEKKALTDPFLADALEGAASISPDQFSMDVSEIDQKLASINKKKIWLTPLRMAAGFVLLIGSFFLTYYFNQPSEQLASKEETPSSGTLGTGDSTTKKDQPELLSLNQTKEEAKTKSELKTESGPVPSKADGAGEAKPESGIATSTQTSPAVVDNLASEDQNIGAERSEIEREEESKEIAKVLTAEPAQQDLKKEALDKDVVARSQSRKNKLAETIQSQKVVRGQVTASEDNQPLPGVNVTVKGTTNGTVTDMEGNYSISLESGQQKIVFSFIGLQTSEVVPGDYSTLNVKLQEDVSQLSEVVVTGQGLKTDRDDSETPVIKLAEPFGGRKAYDKYLENNLRYPTLALESKVKGKVTIEFTVCTDGALRDFSVRKGLGYGCDEEVTRLVKEGPKWTPSTEDNIAIESNVRVKMKFDPAKAKK